MDKIIVIGSSNTDMVVVTPEFPKPGETILGGEFLKNAGGKGANQAVAAARLGGNVSFIGKVGDDLFGKEAVSNIEKEGIDVSSVFTDDQDASGIAQIMVNKEGENCIVVAPGANMKLDQKDIDRAGRQLETAGLVLMQLEIPLETIIYAAQKAHYAGRKVILNPAPAVELPDQLYRSLYMITPNETETELLTGIRVSDQESAAKAAEFFKAKGVRIVIITMGAAGAYIHSDEHRELIPAPKVNAVDTTAAGDCFNGALAVGLARGDRLDEVVRYANRAAAITVTRRGAQSSLPCQRELD